jgi:glutamate carboxypeptidase
MSIPDSIAALPDRTEELASLLESWANVNSGSSHFAGLERMLGLLRDSFASFQEATVELLELPGTSAKALSVKMRPDSKLRVMLSGHYDTVYELEHPFQSCTRLDEHLLRGPGVSDMKGGIVTMLAAMQAFEETPNAAQLGWDVLLTPDEETGSHASVELITQTAKRCHFGLVFEPARVSGDLVRSRKGTGFFIVKCHGRAAHAAQASAGRNAIVALAAFVQAASRVPEELPGVLLNVGRISGGGEATNIVPDYAEAVLDVRITKVSDQAAVTSRLNELVQTANEADGIRIELIGEFNRPPKECLPLEELAFAQWQSMAGELGIAPFSWVHSGGGSDGNFLTVAGLPNLDGVGPIGDHLHSDQEYCVLPSIAQRAQIVALFLHRLASGEISLTNP